MLGLGCGRFGFDEARSSTPDAEAADAAIDAGPACDPVAPFGMPVPIAELNDAVAQDGTLRLAPDELTGYFWSRRAGRGQIYFAMRAALGAPFTIQPVTGLSATSHDLDPTMPTTGTKVLVYRRNGPGDDLWAATAVTDTDFTGAAALATLNSTATDAQPFMRPGTDELIYQSMRTGNGDLYVAMRTGPTTFTVPTKIGELATAAEEGDPVVSGDGLTLYFRSDAPAGALGGHNIYVSTRADTSATWGAPDLVPNVNSTVEDGASALSSDGCRLYISSDRNGTNDIFVATRGS